MQTAFDEGVHSVVRPLHREASHVVEVMFDVILVVIVPSLASDDASGGGILTKAIEKGGALGAVGWRAQTQGVAAFALRAGERRAQDNLCARRSDHGARSTRGEVTRRGGCVIHFHVAARNKPESEAPDLDDRQLARGDGRDERRECGFFELWESVIRGAERVGDVETEMLADEGGIRVDDERLEEAEPTRGDGNF